MNEEFTVSNRIVTLSLQFLGAMQLGRGIYWVTMFESVANENNFYLAFNERIPIWLGGIVLIFFGLSLILASVFYGRRRENHITHVFTLIGGAGGAIMHFLMASAAMYNSPNWLQPYNFILLTGVLGILGFLGGVSLYDRRQ